jgi:hypothetical protein
LRGLAAPDRLLGGSFSVKQLLRTAASLAATVLGGVLLIADGDECSNYDGFRGSARYTAKCGEMASGEGTITLDVPRARDQTAQWRVAQQDLAEGGLDSYRVYLGYTGTCGADEGHLSVSSLEIHFQDAKFHDYVCPPLDLPVQAEHTLTCTRRNVSEYDTSPEIPCTITFRPPEP